MKRGLRRFWSGLADFLLRHPVPVIAVMLLTVAVSSVLALHVRFDFSPQAIYLGNGDLVEYADEFNRTFGYDDMTILIVLEATGKRDVLDASSLQWQWDIVPDLEKVPGVDRVDSLATLQGPHAHFTELKLEPLLKLPIDQASTESFRDLVEETPLLRTGMLSEDNRVCGIPVFVDPAKSDIDATRAIVADVRKVVARHPLPDGYGVRFTGLPELRVEIVGDLRGDLFYLIPLAGVVYLVVLAVMFRRVSGALLPLIAVGIGLSWTMATFRLTHETLNLVSNVLPILLLIIGVSSSVQVVRCYAEEAARTADDQRSAARRAMARMGPVCLLAAITTAIGFASLSTAHSVLLKRFAWQAATGLGYQYISTIITLGTLLWFFSPPRYVGPEERRSNLITRVVTAAGEAVARSPRLTLACAAVLVAGALWMGSRVTINSYGILETFGKESAPVSTLRLVERDLGGVMPLEISLQADRPGSFLDPEVFGRVVEAEHAVGKMPDVLVAQSYADLFREVLIHWPGHRETETDRELVPPGEVGRARLERTAEFVGRFSKAFHYDMYMSADGKRARIRIRLAEIGSRETLDLIRTVEAKLAKIFPPGGPIQARLTGEAYVSAIALSTLIHDLFRSLLTASVVIFVLITIQFRSLRTGLIATLPNLTPLMMTLGYMGLRGYDMNVGNVICFTICLGLADDNTIYFLYRFRTEFEEDGDVVAAIRRTFLGTGWAIVATNVLLFVGMAVMTLSTFIPTRRFGELTEVTIIGNLLGVLLLLPACLVLFWKRRSKGVDTNMGVPTPVRTA